MDLFDLKAGDKVRTVDGAVAEILSETEDGKWIRVRYVAAPLDRSLEGTEDLCGEDEIIEQVENERAAT